MRIGADARTGVLDGEAHASDIGALDAHRNAPFFGELHGIAGEIKQYLAQPRRVADHALRQVVVEIGRDLDTLRLCPRREQLDHVADHASEIERNRFEVEAARLNLREV